MLAQAVLGMALLVADGRLPIPPTPPPPAPVFVPAPVPNPGFDAPTPRAKREVQLAPALTDTQAAGGPASSGYAYGSAFDQVLERRSQPGTAIGNRLAPGLSITIPLK